MRGAPIPLPPTACRVAGRAIGQDGLRTDRVGQSATVTNTVHTYSGRGTHECAGPQTSPKRSANVLRVQTATKMDQLEAKVKLLVAACQVKAIFDYYRSWKSMASA